MHAQFKVGDTAIMASDGRCGGNPVIQGVSLTITTETTEQAEKLFGALAEGGQVQMPLTKTFFAALWHGGRPVRRWLDDPGSALNRRTVL